MTAPVISSISSLPAAKEPAPTPPSNQLGKDDFLKLLTAQLQNQDPLQPTDNQAFVAQLAQFSSLEQLQDLGKKLDAMTSGQGSATQLSASSLIGKDVRFKADHLSLRQGGTAAFRVSQDGASDDTVALVADATGRVVRRLDLGARGAGSFDVTWDGLDASGSGLPSGDYVLTVSATRKDGAPVQASPNVRGTVSGVTFDGSSTAELLVAGRTVQLSDVLEIDSDTP